MTDASPPAPSGVWPKGVTIADPRSVPIVGIDGHLPPVSSERLSATALRRRFIAPPAWQPDFLADHQRPVEGTRAAAVLMGIVDRAAGPTMLLTRRSARLARHSGQVAFPGGRRDDADQSLIQTALREAHEEVGLEPARVEILGLLPAYVTGTQYCVTPVVALVDPGLRIVPQPDEVESVFEVPLEFLMDPRNHERRHLISAEGERQFISMPWRVPGENREYFIWGVTAALLRNLYRMLSA
jgi:8-oxo-dGTP pyrophosphatase MutT (NUDIX family)